MATTQRTITKAFPITLSDEALRARGQDQARIYQNILDKKEAAKAKAAEFKAEIKALEEEQARLARVVGTGVEWQDVACEERFYPASNQVVLHRMDTGAEVETRPMTSREWQLSLDDAAAAIDAIADERER